MDALAFEAKLEQRRREREDKESARRRSSIESVESAARRSSLLDAEPYVDIYGIDKKVGVENVIYLRNDVPPNPSF